MGLGITAKHVPSFVWVCETAKPKPNQTEKPHKTKPPKDQPQAGKSQVGKLEELYATVSQSKTRNPMLKRLTIKDRYFGSARHI